MGLISLLRVVNGAVSDASHDINNNCTTLENLLNGNLDSSNLAADSVGSSELQNDSVGDSEMQNTINVGTSLAEAGKRVVAAGGRNYGNVGTGAATAETDLQTKTITGGTLPTSGFMVRIYAWGTVSGTNSTKTIKLYFGATVLATIALPAGATDGWAIDAIVAGSSVGGQKARAFASVSALNASPVPTITTPAQDMTLDVIVKTTGTTPNSADEVTSQVLVLEWCKDTT